jgi:hypothetical protein
LFHAQAVSRDELDEATDTELTRAARKSVDNADRIIDAEEFRETDFVPEKAQKQAEKLAQDKRKKARKAERKRKSQSKARKRK